MASLKNSSAKPPLVMLLHASPLQNGKVQQHIAAITAITAETCATSTNQTATTSTSRINHRESHAISEWLHNQHQQQQTQHDGGATTPVFASSFTSPSYEIPDLESDQEIQDCFKALLGAKKSVQLKAVPFTKENLTIALQEAHVVLIGSHGLPPNGNEQDETASTSAIIAEGDVLGEAEILTIATLKTLLDRIPSSKIVSRLVFVSACHSEVIGDLLVKYGVDHVTAIRGDNRVSNLVSRSFFQNLLQSTLRGVSIEDSQELAIRAVETHSELSEERQKRQREKFIHFKKDQGARSVLFDDREITDGVPQTLTEPSPMFGFSRFGNAFPRPLFGRQTLMGSIVSALTSGENNFVVLSQKERGLGSSIVINYISRYLADRMCFEEIHLFESFKDFLAFMKEHNTFDANASSSNSSASESKKLIVIDQACYVKETSEEDWFWLQLSMNKLPTRDFVFLVVDKHGKNKFAYKIDLSGLDHIYADALRNHLMESAQVLQEQQPARSVNSTNPGKIISAVRDAYISQINLLQMTESSPSVDLGDLLESIIQESVVGPFALWRRTQRRNLQQNEIDFVKSIAARYKSLDAFWQQWLKPTLLTLSALEPFWTNRSILGFISDGQTKERALKGKEPGTFLLRCSENLPGRLTLSDVTDDRKISKSSITVNSDGSIVLPTEKTPLVTYPDLHSALHVLKHLRKVVISHDGSEEMDKSEAFTDLL